MEAWPTSTSLRSMEQGRLATYVHPAESIRPRSAQARVFGLGAERAAARGYVIPDDSGSEEERAAGDRARSRRSRAGAERSLIGMVEVQRYMQWTSMEPAGGVMNRLRCGRSSDLDGRSLHIAGPGQHAGPRHSTAPNGVRRGTRAGRCWTGSKAETRGGPSRAGRRSKMYRWRLVTSQCQQTTVTETIPQRFVTLLYKDPVESSEQ